MRPHPHLYEINTWPWLESLSRRLRPIADARRRSSTRSGTRSRALGIDLVYLMGIWRRSPLGRELARSNRRDVRRRTTARLPGWQPSDVVGSAYSHRRLRAGSAHRHRGTMLDACAPKLHARGMRLIVDFIPNHTGFDHPWMARSSRALRHARPRTFRRTRAVPRCRAVGRRAVCRVRPRSELPAVDRRRAARLLQRRHARRAMIGELRSDRGARRRRTLRHGDARAVRRVRRARGAAPERAGSVHASSGRMRAPPCPGSC